MKTVSHANLLTKFGACDTLVKNIVKKVHYYFYYYKFIFVADDFCCHYVRLIANACVTKLFANWDATFLWYTKFFLWYYHKHCFWLHTNITSFALLWYLPCVIGNELSKYLIFVAKLQTYLNQRLNVLQTLFLQHLVFWNILDNKSWNEL